MADVLCRTMTRTETDAICDRYQRPRTALTEVAIGTESLRVYKLFEIVPGWWQCTWVYGASTWVGVLSDVQLGGQAAPQGGR